MIGKQNQKEKKKRKEKESENKMKRNKKRGRKSSVGNVICMSEPTNERTQIEFI